MGVINNPGRLRFEVIEVVQVIIFVDSILLPPAEKSFRNPFSLFKGKNQLSVQFKITNVLNIELIE